jgi:pyruvate dehydrogenase E2 component (dihydrolipoamide acetyltransferase)
MAVELFIPKLGQTVEEVTLISWLVADGAKVSQGQEVMEVETDKAVFPVEANGRGYIHIGPYEAGQVLPVLTVVAIIGKETDKFEVSGAAETANEENASSVAEISSESTSSELTPASAGEGAKEVFASPRARKLAASKNVPLSQLSPTGFGGLRVAERDVLAYLGTMPKITPLAQRMAVDSGVDLRNLTATGPGGRIGKEDVTRAMQQAAPVETKAAPQIDHVAVQSAAAPASPDVKERIPLKGVRAIIADRMGTSVHTTARVTLMMEVDATEFVAARERIKAKVAEEWGFAPGYNDLLAKVVALALRKFPYMNARLTSEAIEILNHVNLGLAVDTERGLLVPVVRDADQKSMREFGGEFRQMVERARNGRALPEDLNGGSFTITNLGMYEVDAFTPVINLPEAAILGVGQIAPKVVPFNGKPEIRQMMTLSLVFDHRIVDGAPAARFMQFIKHVIEEPYLLIAG